MARILLVDDEESVRGLLKRGLELDLHDVELATDGAHALEVLEQYNGSFDLIISDIRMPELDGIALAHSVKKNYSYVPVLLMTGYAEQRERAQELDNIVEGVLSKPFGLGELRKAVKEILS